MIALETHIPRRNAFVPGCVEKKRSVWHGSSFVSSVSSDLVEQLLRRNRSLQFVLIMDNFRKVFQRVAASVPKGGAAPQVPKGGGTAVAVLLTLGAAGYGAYHSMVTIQPGHVGLIYNRFGGLDDNKRLAAGLNFVIPWFQRSIVYDIRTRPQPIDTQSGSKGTLQNMN